MKDDRKQFRAVCRHLGMTREEQEDFSEQVVHGLKDSGGGGSANERGDFTWHELLELGREYLEETRG